MINVLLPDVVVDGDVYDNLVMQNECFLDLLVVAEGVVVDEGGDDFLVVAEELEDRAADVGNIVDETVSNFAVIEVLGEDVLVDAEAVDELVVLFNAVLDRTSVEEVEVDFVVFVAVLEGRVVVEVVMGETIVDLAELGKALDGRVVTEDVVAEMGIFVVLVG